MQAVRHPTNSPERVAKKLVARLDLTFEKISTIQTLWAGYGHICAVKARTPSGETKRLILKIISPPKRGEHDDESHRRKMLSYGVEQYFYVNVAGTLPNDVAVAKCLATETDKEGMIAMLLTDLRPEFPVAGGKRSVLTPTQVRAALSWLAKFHAASWAYLPNKADLPNYVLPPLEEHRTEGTKLWLNGGYTYLATRLDELASLRRGKSEWAFVFCDTDENGNSAASLAAEFLTPRGRPIETLIHGDVKSENLFTTKDGHAVAFFDFQYVGLGLGVCDLAKLFTCAVPEGMLADEEGLEEVMPTLAMGLGEKNLLRTYISTLKGPYASNWDMFVRHWETALVDWCRFQASWGFWGNTAWLEARVRHIIAEGQWRDWIEKEVAMLREQ